MSGIRKRDLGRFDVFVRDGFRCCYCGRSVFEHDILLEVDHLVPKDPITNHAAGVKSSGARCALIAFLGATEDDAWTAHSNLVTSCHDCNHGKNATMLPPSILAEIRSAIARRILSHNLGAIEIPLTLSTDFQHQGALYSATLTGMEASGRHLYGHLQVTAVRTGEILVDQSTDEPFSFRIHRDDTGNRTSPEPGSREELFNAANAVLDPLVQGVINRAEAIHQQNEARLSEVRKKTREYLRERHLGHLLPAP